MVHERFEPRPTRAGLTLRRQLRRPLGPWPEPSPSAGRILGPLPNRIRRGLSRPAGAARQAAGVGGGPLHTTGKAVAGPRRPARPRRVRPGQPVPPARTEPGTAEPRVRGRVNELWPAHGRPRRERCFWDVFKTLTT